MSCNCANAGGTVGTVGEDQPVLQTYQMPEETTECYMARAAGTPDGAGAPPIDKIATLNIGVDCEMKVNTPFKMTPESSLPVTWELEIKNEDGNVVQPSDIGLTFDTSSGLLQGTILPAFEKKIFNAHMKALKDGNTVDEKSYKFVPKKCDPSDLRFINPNPGSTKTSNFGPRVHPVTGVKKMHKGVDLASRGKNDILAAADGVVSYVGSRSGYGNVVEIEHKNSSGELLAMTRYAHLAIQYVDVGEQVAAGIKIGHEGNTGIGTGPHLHFEIWLGGSVPVDPMLYINGQVITDPGSETGAITDPGEPSGQPTQTVTNTQKALTQEEVKAKSTCPEFSNPGKDPTYKNEPDGKSPDDQHFQKTAQCRPQDPMGHPPKDEVISRINAQLDKHPELDASDRQWFIDTCKIECSYDPYAGAGTTSALGPFQMVNATAAAYYSKIGVQATCENRCNIEYAVEAQIRYYKVFLAIYNEYKAHGTILKRTPPTNAHTALYPTLTKGAFIYVAHHDGPGSLQRGKDLQGLGYWNTHSPHP